MTLEESSEERKRSCFKELLLRDTKDKTTDANSASTDKADAVFTFVVFFFREKGKKAERFAENIYRGSMID